MNNIEAIHIFSLSHKNEGFQPYTKNLRIGDWIISSSDRTNLYHQACEENEIVIVGDCCDLTTGKADLELAKILIDECHDINELLLCEYSLGGKYVIIYKRKADIFLIPDASGSIPVNYVVGDKGLCCSSINEIAEVQNLIPNEKLLKIRESGLMDSALPADITIYREIKQLLPNHYLHVNTGKAHRIIVEKTPLEQLSVSECVDKTIPLIKTLTDYFKTKYDLVCPITSGRDSRVVMSFLGIDNPILECFTMKLDGFTDDTPDIKYAKQLAETKGYPYNLLLENHDCIRFSDYINQELGEFYDKKTLMLANTIVSQYGKSAIVNGDIIGQIGKCSLHRDISQNWASPSYFLCKLHNYSKKAKDLLAVWMKEINDSGEQVSNFDLFSMEIRMGRWAAQENIIYNLVGQCYLNIFNSRSIIYQWTRVDRKLRKNSEIHKEYIRRLDYDLLSVPFESDGLFFKIAKYNAFTYYVTSFIKHYASGLKFKLKNGKS